MTNDKLRSISLAALVVLSVFAGSIAFAGSAAAANLDDGERYWQGQTVTADQLKFDSDGDGTDDSTVSGDTKLEVMKVVDEGSNTLAKELYSDEDGGLTLETTNLEGSYVLQRASDDAEIATFSVASQDLSASFDPDTVDNKFSTKSDLKLDSKRAGYDVTVSADGLSKSELSSIFGPSDEDPNTDGYQLTGITSDTISTNFVDVNAGNYTIELEVVDTGATAEATINVTKGGSATASFEDSDVVAQERGDVANFTVDLDNAKQSTVTIGSSEVNWVTNFTVHDDNDDGNVTIDFNTYKTGSNTWTSSPANDLETVQKFITVEEGDSISLSSVDDDSNGNNANNDQGVHYGSDLEAGTTNNPIADGDYELTVGAAGEETDVNQLVLSKGSVDGAQSWTYPETATNIDGLNTLLDNVAQDNSVAMDDLAVVQIDASGLYGHLDKNNAKDLLDKAAGNNQDYYSLNFTQTNAGANADGNKFNGANNDVETYFDAQNNTFFAVVDTTGDTAGIQAGDEYNATFTLHKGSPLTKKAQSATTEFTVEQRTLEFTGLNESDVLEIGAGNATIKGDTSMAAGSEFSVKVKSDSFVRTSTATVNENGTFTADFDFSNVNVGTNVEVSASNGDASDTVEGVIVESTGGSQETTTATTNGTSTTTTTTTTTTTSSTTETTTTETTTTDTTTTNGGSSGIPGFGVSVSLVALVAGALLALRRSN
ncbi:MULTISPECIES: BGTF surface domain-containing protein [Halorussus]|uniref:DUF7827 domain-containing protein n=1 Tax=Halorussus TaxID=1070314 RepID=UPI00209CB0C7|nr:BGTF surface domain-containing protein [Halorussus vallis]USZ77061.1 surface glycoprotein [Halorussus vallis]